MANPQAENGHVDIANQIVEALARTRLSGEEIQCLWVILRKTYGWKKTEDIISLSQFTEMTGLKKQHVHRALLKLSSKKVIDITKNGYNRPNMIRFIKDFDVWIMSPKKVMYPKMVKDITKNGSTLYPKMVNTKDTTTKDTITKDIYGEFKNVLLTAGEKKKLDEMFGSSKAIELIESLSMGIESKGYRYKSHYATILNWERRHSGADQGNSRGPYREFKGKSTKYAHLTTTFGRDSAEQKDK